MDLNPAILHAYDKNRDKNSFRMPFSELKHCLRHKDYT